MGLSRLSNFLRSVRGTVLHVNPDSLDSSDSIENTGTSPITPFKTIQRALAEAARYSYQSGKDNDRFDKTTILLYPGEHVVDNRPGYIPQSVGNNVSFRTRAGNNVTDFGEWTGVTSFDLEDPDNHLYKLNSVFGGIILPRGTSIVGQDLRKTIIRPLYVPNPVNDNIDHSAIFRLTGGCFINGVTILDANPSGVCYKDYTKNLFVPNFSHHKLNVFEFADGVNQVKIDDDFTTIVTSRTDLEMYYEKIGLIYGLSSGRPINNDYPSASIDIQPVIDEYQIVGSRGKEAIIADIYAGNRIVSGNVITVELEEEVPEINTDTAIQIQGVSTPAYNGNYVVNSIIDSKTITYRVQNPPPIASPNFSGATLNIAVDSVTSASPYIFNCSLRSVYGMCGLLADGSKATGFKSMIVAQYTAIGLQKDQRAFVKYNNTTGVYGDSTQLVNLNSDSRAIYKPSYSNYHIKATNNAFIQLVSIFSIGFANHFVTESGGDLSITNSNSNFGSKGLVSKGYREDAFPRDNQGYITHIINPREIDVQENSVEFLPIDVQKTISVGNTGRLYLYGYQNSGEIPSSVLDGYRIGARQNDTLYVQISRNGVINTHSAKIVMPNTNFTSRTSAEKSFVIGQSTSGISSIGVSRSNVIDLTQSHNFITGEGVKIYSETGNFPGGLDAHQTYYAITSTTDIALLPNQIKLAQTENDAVNNQELSINTISGKLRVVSKVIDKHSGDTGHPIQSESVSGGWYINVSGISTENNIYSTVVGLGTTSLGEATSRTYIRRRVDNRTLNDKIFKVRYVIPKDAPTTARPPLEGYVIQESKYDITSSEVEKYFAPSATLDNSNELRTLNIISGATWSSVGIVTVTTELPHNLSVGSVVEIKNINPSGYNGVYTVSSVNASRSFSYQLAANPGTFASDTSTRNASIPRFIRKNYNNTYYVYKSEEIQGYVPNSKDGIYHLTVLNASNSPVVAPFTDQKFSQPVQNLYPQLNRDNPNSNPDATSSFALPSPIGQVIVNDPEKSITKETIEKQLFDTRVGLGITNIVSVNANSHIIYTSQDHQYSGISSVTVINVGSNYIPGTYYGVNLVGTSGTSANAKIIVDQNGRLSSLTIIHPGGGYIFNEDLQVIPPVGIGVTSGFTPAVVRVNSVRTSIGEVISVQGITHENFKSYNTNYRITSVANPKQLNVVSTRSVTGFTTLGIGVTVSSNCAYIPVGRSVSVSSLNYNRNNGTATIGFSTSHNFRVNQKIIISGANDSFFNGEFNVVTVTNVSTAIIRVGISTVTPITTGNIVAHRSIVNSSYGDDEFDESRSGRLSYTYGGVTATTGSALNFTDPDNITINIPNAPTLGLRLGDYILIDDEIFRIRATVTGNNVSVFRSLFGTPRQTHPINSLVTTIKIQPIEFRKNSMIRAAGHTFEYVGFGPGNYSSALPERQDRILSKAEEVLSQSTTYDGGSLVFSGMNNAGDFYTGNRIVRSSTGLEEVYNSPIPSVSGEEGSPDSVTSEVIFSSDLLVHNSLKVEGGSNNNLLSQFSGPVLFNQKITSNNGIETKELYLQGDEEISRKFSVSNQKPDYAGNYGDVVWNSEPNSFEPSGWVYTLDGNWAALGVVGKEIDQIGISTGTFNTYVGLATQINFDSYGLGLVARTDNTTGITTVTYDATHILESISQLEDAVGFATTKNTVRSLDNISNLFDGSRTSFPLTIGNVAVIPQDSKQLIISVGGVIQNPNTDFSISGSNIVFHTAPLSQLSFFGSVFGKSSFPGDTNSYAIRTVDDISNSFNGINDTFPLILDGIPIFLSNSQQILVNLGGVIQDPLKDYYISGSNIVFLTPPDNGLRFFGMILGEARYYVYKLPGTPNKSVQYNNNGKLEGVSSLIYNSNTNSLTLSGVSSDSLLRIHQEGTGHALIVEDVYIPGTGYVGLGSTAPVAKLDIFAPSQQALKIRSTSGFGNIISIENELNDILPIIFDVNGNLGINTTTAVDKFEVYGNAKVSGELRITDSSNSSYVGLKAPSVNSNFVYTLPNSYGNSGQVLASDGQGNLSWVNNTGFTSTNITSGVGIAISYTTVGSQTRAIVSNTGITKINSGIGITITQPNNDGEVTVSMVATEFVVSPYPFTTKGFNIPF